MIGGHFSYYMSQDPIGLRSVIQENFLDVFEQFEADVEIVESKEIHCHSVGGQAEFINLNKSN
jgi:hypothetical protein